MAERTARVRVASVVATAVVGSAVRAAGTLIEVATRAISIGPARSLAIAEAGTRRPLSARVTLGRSRTGVVPAATERSAGAGGCSGGRVADRTAVGDGRSGIPRPEWRTVLSGRERTRAAPSRREPRAL